MGPAKTPFSLTFIQTILILSVVLIFPVMTYAVFVLGWDRKFCADVISTFFGAGFYGAFLVPWLFVSLPWWQKLNNTVLLWLWVAYMTALTWELPWIVLHEQIQQNRDNPMFYTWWAYIDGGDIRYAYPTPSVFMLESETIFHCFIGFIGLMMWYKSGGNQVKSLLLDDASRAGKKEGGPVKWMPESRRLAILMICFSATIHMFFTAYYLFHEVIAGFPHVNTKSWFDVYIKFGVVNSPWLVMPFFVLVWGNHQLKRVAE